MNYTLLFGGIEKEIPQELAESLLNTEGLRIQIRRARDCSFADVFGVLDKNLKRNRGLKFIDFQPNDDVSAGDVLLVPDVGELRITSIDPQIYDGKPYALRAYVSYPPATILPPEK